MSKLTAADRKKVRKWGIPPKDGEEGHYPIPDANHARDALARVSGNGSSAQKAEVRRAVHRDYPGIKMAGMRPTQ